MVWVTSHADQPPELVDISSSPTTAYLRRNVKEVQQEDFDGKMKTVYEYEEASIPIQEYAAILAADTAETAAQNQADIEYIAMEMGVEL